MRDGNIKWKKWIAAILGLVMIVQLIPLQIYAEELANDKTAGSAAEMWTEASAQNENAIIIGEISEKREENVKHFLNNDGSFTAVKYFEPVHYRDGSGRWVDIDNTLSLSTAKIDDENVRVYTPENSPLNVEFKQNFGGNGTVYFSSQGYQISWTYSLDQDNDRLPVVDEKIKTEETVEELPAVEKKTTENEIVEESFVAEEGLAAEPEDITTSEPVATEEDVPVAEDVVEENIQQKVVSVTAEKIQQVPMHDKQDVNAKFTVLEDLTDGLCYSNVYPNVDLEYILDSVYLKENIVLKDKTASNRYVINYHIGDLEAEQVDAQEIALKDSSGKPIFTIIAPYMSDAAEKICEKVSLNILSQKNGIVRVEIEADRDWLQDENRVYPVKIDPYVNETVRNFEYDASALYIKDTYPYGTLCVGNDQGANYGKMKSYVKFGLPTLSAGDVITGGYLHLAKYAGEAGYSHVGNPNLQINVYRVTSTWSESSVKASSGYSGLPSINSTVVDYQIVHAESEAEWVTFDVSKVVKAWYEGTANYGLCLRANDQDAWAFAKFVASDNSAYASARPTLQVTYRNNKGLENYWTTHDQSLGESGCGYVNDYTGNLVYIAPLLSTTGNRMPVSLSLIYNGYQHGSNVDRTNTVGKGWRLNIQEKITPITNSGGLNSKLYEQGFRYAYDDADGTTHYFKADSNISGKFVDEDGLGLTLTVNSTVTDSEKYTVTADTGGKMTFMPSGQLRKVYDDNGNYYKIFYDDSTLRISRIVDGAGRTITIDSNSNGRITSITDPADRVITFVYSSDWDGLRRIEYPDGSKTQFYYTDSGARLNIVDAINGTRLTYSYPTNGDAATKSRVTNITEYSSGTTRETGNSLTIDYDGMNRTKFTDNEGRSETYQFDNFGRTVGLIDAAGNGSQYSYTNSENKKKNNTLQTMGAAQKYVDNRLINHNFENNLSNWDYTGGKVATDSSKAYYGSKSEKLNPEGVVSQKLNKNPSYAYYTSSVYAMGNSNNSRIRLSVYFYDADGAYLSSKWSEQDLVGGKWERKQFTFTLAEGAASFRVRYVNCGTDNIWIDCAQLENGAAMNAYNMVQNGDFENTSADVWEAVNCTSSDKYYTGGAYGRHFYMKGDGSTAKRLVQKIYINRKASKLFLSVSGYAYANSVPMDENKTRRFALSVAFHFTDGTESYEYIPFNPDYAAGWQYASGTVGVKDAGEKTVDYIYIRCCYYNNANGANFDRIQVNIDEYGTSYTYDDDGNLISAKDNAGRYETYGYNSASDMTSLTTADNKAYNFTYSNTYKHRLLSAVSVSSGVKNSFDYDDYGNLTKTTVQKSDGSGRAIKQYNSYTSNGNYLAAAYNDRGYATTYNYNNTKGTLSSVTDPNGRTTSYEYDPNNDRMTTVSSGSSEVSYGYNNVGRLTSITSPSTNYTFGYDTWGNNTTVSIGNRTLVTNSYAANNGNLLSSRYGGENDGFTIGYSYDSLDRPTAKKYNGTTYFTWRYNADGNVAGYSDNILDKTYTYTYDSLGRLLQAGCSDGSYIKTSYDDVDKSTQLHYKFNGQRRDVYFEYCREDNLPKYVQFGTDSAYKVTNTYDKLTRLSNKQYAVVGNQDTTLKSSYSYIDWSGENSNRTTGVVRGIDYTFVKNTDDLSTHDRWYTYDNAGNILTESVWIGGNEPNLLRESYTYDSKNQLTRHDSVTQGKSFKYYYDAAGNITSKKEYAYATGDLDETTATTVNYTYGDSSWGDLLTAYNGQAISYDAIGNPTSYLGWSFDWTGRSLTGATKDSQTLSFTYNSDGIRTSKTVNGVKTEYLLNGSQILAQKTGSNTLCFFYDQQGNRVGMADSSNHFYYYLYNLQGDVIAIADASTGKLAATYTYDAWGKIVKINGIDPDSVAESSIAKINPFRYRGYYYDTETGLYYLNSRYYDPEIGRWINADSVMAGVGGDVKGYNLFAYCFNNPVNMDDQTGNWPKWIKNTVKWVAKNIVKPVVKTVQKTLSKVDLTYSTGVNVSGTPSAWIFNGQIGVSMDTKGNVAIQASGGGGITGGNPGISITLYQSVTNAPNIDKLNDAYYQVGGSIAVPIEGVPVAAGGDVMFMPDTELNTGYFGLTGNVGFGTPGMEFHVEWGTTVTLPYTQFNVYEVARSVYIKIMEW